MSAAPPLIAHVIHRLQIGGLENGLVNLINTLDPSRYRHAIVCLTEYTDFAARIRRGDVSLHALNKGEGNDPWLQVRLWRMFRALRPDIVHTRNLAAVEAVVAAALAGVRHRVHGEHGRDMVDLAGTRAKYVWLRRALSPLVGAFIPMSKDLERWLRQVIGVPPARIHQIYSGVDTTRFRPAPDGRAPLPIADFAPPDAVVIGSVGRMEPVKDQLTFARAFLGLRDALPGYRSRLRLVQVGDGPLHGDTLALLDAHGAGDVAWLPGARDDVPDLLRGFDVFVLPSLAEGISNTILEAMASGLPVVATRVGGNAELVTEGETGRLVPVGDPQAMAGALRGYVEDPQLRARHGAAARARVEASYSLQAMAEAYARVYDTLLQRCRS